MKKWLVLLCCAFLLASWFTTGLSRSLVELAAFVTIVTLVWRYSGSAKVDDVEQRSRADNQPEQ
ncbi:hypothetical protein L1D40_13155 [Shewanella insulae]|uniref:hypothetical protein n=1 Tax=Shewanella insulae TaxID=2681496 RepID=UPI001EFD0620|nr:hypothetical protein [Shewanella insulae]MCG9712657.1 hypothetical protein [Shewanella insulae]MCG9756157.1 hypothetical protein [Shewanella insulae]